MFVLENPFRKDSKLYFAFREEMGKQGLCVDCGNLYDFDQQEPFAHCGCHTSEWYNATPAQICYNKIRNDINPKITNQLKVFERLAYMNALACLKSVYPDAFAVPNLDPDYTTYRYLNADLKQLTSVDYGPVGNIAFAAKLSATFIDGSSREITFAFARNFHRDPEIQSMNDEIMERVMRSLFAGSDYEQLSNLPC